MPRFKSGGKVYDLARLDEVTPRDLLTFPRDASEVMGRPIRFSDMQRIGNEIEALPDDEAERHPDFDFLFTVLLWISLRAAGVMITYGESLDVPFEMLDDPPPGKAPAAKKAAKKRQSGNPAKRAAAAAR